MKCPYCGGTTRVINSRESGGETLRERLCIVCFKDFYTTEALSETKATRLRINRAVTEAKKRASDRNG